MGSAFHQLCPRYSAILTRTAPGVVMRFLTLGSAPLHPLAADQQDLFKNRFFQKFLKNDTSLCALNNRALMDTMKALKLTYE